jgi:hypothetical protein
MVASFFGGLGNFKSTLRVKVEHAVAEVDSGRDRRSNFFQSF